MMRGLGARLKRINDRMILLGIVFGALFWIVESIVHVFIFHKGDLISEMFTHDPHEIWMRSVIVGLFIIFGAYVQFLVNRRKKADQRIEHINLVLQAIRNVNQLITREKDRDKLLQGVCNNLVENRGYYNAWVALVDESGKLLKTAEAGLGDDFLPMLERLERGELTDCGRTALSQSDIVITEDPLSTCADCPLAEKYSGRWAMTIRLAHEGKVYGLLSVSIGERLPGYKEEKALFGEVAEDIAYALHNMEKEDERKLVELALVESEKRYRELVNSITDFIYSHNLEGRFTTINRAATETLGYVPEDLIGHLIPDFMLPEHQEAFKKEYLAQIKENGSSDGVSIYLAKDGSKHYIEYRSVLVKQEGMEPFVNGSGRDITDKVLSEIELRRLQDQLQRAEKMEAIGTLAGGVAHDLNNILSGLVSYPELLLLEIPKDSPLRDPMLTIQKSGEKAVAIVQDLLTMARRGVAVTEVVNLNQIIHSYLTSPEHEKLKEFHSNLRIETNLEKDVLNIMGSPAHLLKTVMNLVSNAAEAMPDGGTICLSTKSAYIDKAIRGYDHIDEGDYVAITVSDTGMGIYPKDMKRIFEPFYTKKVMGRSGTGLGMAVVWGTVKDHKGYIDVQSAEGEGSTFTLYFPVTRKEIEGKEKALPMEDYMGKGESILVVDDVEEQREIASRILKKLGYSVASVASGNEAVDYMKDNPADLLILDMIMEPGFDGLETYKRILKFRPGQKAVIASGFSETNRVKAAQRLGAGKYIKKPYTLEKIGIAVKNELS